MKDLLRAAIELRVAQRVYMANRGNDAYGKVVAEKAAALDLAIEEAKAPSSEAVGRTEMVPLTALNEEWETMQKDAARYRWMKANAVDSHMWNDESIDAAMRDRSNCK